MINVIGWNSKYISKESLNYMLCFLPNALSVLLAKIVIARNRMLFTSDFNISINTLSLKNNLQPHLKLNMLEFSCLFKRLVVILFEQSFISSFLQKRVDLFSDLPIMRPHWDGERQRIARHELLSQSSKT